MVLNFFVVEVLKLFCFINTNDAGMLNKQTGYETFSVQLFMNVKWRINSDAKIFPANYEELMRRRRQTYFDIFTPSAKA